METKQSVLIMTTERNSLRAEVVGWTYEKSSNVRPDMEKPIGISSIDRSQVLRYPTYDCPVRALANGWKLLVPPTSFTWKNDEGKEFTNFEWWFVKEESLY